MNVDNFEEKSSSLGYFYMNPGSEIHFLDYAENYCVCFVDMINSTQRAAMIYEPIKLREYYSIFLNAMAEIAKRFRGRIIKNGGDSILFYFPDTADPSKTHSFKQVLDCCLEMSKAHDVINSITEFEHLPTISYRISADYGKVEIAKSKSSIENDLIGSTMNICSKINSKATPNGVVIGSDLCGILQRHCLLEHSSRNYHFEQVGEYSLGLKYSYPIFSVSAAENSNGDLIKSLNSNSCVWPRNNQKYKILLVDDEQDILSTYKHMLNNAGVFEVDAYSNSQEALKQFFSVDTNYYNLVITDVRMPPPNGLQLYSIIRTTNKNIKIVFVTAYDVIEEVLSMLPDVHDDEIIKKPIRQESLIRQVKIALA